jgi:hypothetical protein
VRRSLLIALIGLLALPGTHAAVRANCSQTSEPMTPLTDLGKKRYHGYQGGLYASGKNTPTPVYLKKGLAAAKRVHPIDGRIVLLSIGMSNTTQEFSAF